MPLKDLFVECPQPAQAQIEVTCKNCHHFADVPLYSVDGKKTVCSNERIGRRPNQVPCPNFAVNMSLFKKMKPETMRLLFQLLGTMELDFPPDKTKAQKGRDLQSLNELSLALRAISNARKSGYDLGGNYSVEGKDIEGVLVSLGRDHATIKTHDTGVAYTVDNQQITQSAT